MQTQRTETAPAAQVWPPSGVKWYYSDDYVCIAHADCRDILPSIGGFDVVITDPPYGVGKGYDDAPPDTPNAFADYAAAVVGLGVPTAMFSSVTNLWRAPEPDWIGVFRKRYGALAMFSMPIYPHWEPILFYHIKGNYFGNKGHRSDVFESMPEKASATGHPSPKPVEVMKQIIEFMPAGVILDPFAGSGTTLLAAKELRRKAIGVEISWKYCEISAKRMAQGVLEF